MATACSVTNFFTQDPKNRGTCPCHAEKPLVSVGIPRRISRCSCCVAAGFSGRLQARGRADGDTVPALSGTVVGRVHCQPAPHPLRPDSQAAAGIRGVASRPMSASPSRRFAQAQACPAAGHRRGAGATCWPAPAPRERLMGRRVGGAGAAGAPRGAIELFDRRCRGRWNSKPGLLHDAKPTAVRAERIVTGVCIAGDRCSLVVGEAPRAQRLADVNR